MPIKSYLATPVRGMRDELADAFRALAGCEVIPAENRDVLVLVTDTPDEKAEQVLQETLARVPGLASLALVAGLAETAPAGPRGGTT